MVTGNRHAGRLAALAVAAGAKPPAGGDSFILEFTGTSPRLWAVRDARSAGLPRSAAPARPACNRRATSPPEDRPPCRTAEISISARHSTRNGDYDRRNPAMARSTTEGRRPHPAPRKESQSSVTQPGHAHGSTSTKAASTSSWGCMTAARLKSAKPAGIRWTPPRAPRRRGHHHDPHQ
jgi:hypothetical protein